jgi:hypothetical protein
MVAFPLSLNFSAKKNHGLSRFPVRQWFKILCSLLKTLHQGSPCRRSEKDAAENIYKKVKKTAVSGNSSMFPYVVHQILATYLIKRGVRVKHF